LISLISHPSGFLRSFHIARNSNREKGAMPILLDVDVHQWKAVQDWLLIFDATKSESIGDDPIAECALLQMPGGSTVLLHPHLAHSEANLPSCHSHLRLIVTYSSEDQLERWIWPNSCLRDPPSHPFFVSISLLLLQLSFFLLFSLLLSLISDGVLLHVERITAVF
jgi:hypothetical protein